MGKQCSIEGIYEALRKKIRVYNGKEVVKMILFMILALILVTLLTITILAISAGGTLAIVLFGDVIVCIVFIALIMKHLIAKRKKK